MEATNRRFESAILAAGRNGRRAGEQAAGWWEQDALGGRNTNSQRVIAGHATKLLAMWDDGDPRADEFLGVPPNLSGEWADGPSPLSVLADVDWDPEDEGADDICAAWADGASQGYYDAVTRYLRQAAQGGES